MRATMPARAAWLALILLLGVATAAGAAEQPAEPDSFWTGPMGGPVPATIAGGTVIDTAALAALVEGGQAVLVDASPAPHRPAGMTEESWQPPPHRTIPGSAWLADVGAGALDARYDAWYRARLAALTGGDTARPVVVFCHPDCWASWNAARRAILYGYTAVHWYPGGIERWQDADRPTEAVAPQAPPP